MLGKINSKVIVIITATVLLLVAGFYIKEKYYGDNTCPANMTTVGGKDNPCQCTKRIEP